MKRKKPKNEQMNKKLNFLFFETNCALLLLLSPSFTPRSKKQEARGRGEEQHSVPSQQKLHS